MMVSISQDRLDELNFYLRINYPIYLVSYKEHTDSASQRLFLDDLYTISELFYAKIFKLENYDQDKGILNTLVLKDITIFYNGAATYLEKGFEFSIKLDEDSNKNFIEDYYGS